MAGFAAIFAPVFLRIAGLLLFAPLIGGRIIPARLKLLFAAVLSLAAAGSMPAANVPATDWQIAVALGAEFMIGAAMGLALSLVFVGAQMAGQIAGQQMGLNLAGSVDPAGAAGSNPLAQLYYILAAFVFLLMDGHHLLILGLRASLEHAPPMSIALDASLLSALTGMLAAATILALSLAAPVCVALLVVDLALGMIGKTIPQMNFMSIGMTLRTAAGLVIVLLGLGVTAGVLAGAIGDTMRLAEGFWAAR